MKSSHTGILGLAAAIGLLAGCTDTSVGSDTVRTQGIWASFEVKATSGSSARLSAQLRVGGGSGTYVYPLVPPDQLKVLVDDEARDNLGATCSTKNSYCSGNLGETGGKEIRVNFDRGEVVENAPNSTVVMPKAFQVSAQEDEVLRGRDVALELSGEARNLKYSLEGDCIFSKSDGLNSSGVIPGDAFKALSSKAEQDCEVTITVTRTVEGSLDPAFGKGGRIYAVQERQVKILSLATEGSNTDTTSGSSSGSTSSTSSSDSLDGGTDSGTDGGDAGDGGNDSGMTADAGDGGDDSGVSVDTSTGVDTSSTSSGSSSTSSSSESTSEMSSESDAGDAGADADAN